MEDQAKETSGNNIHRSETLKPFSDSDLMEELENRLRSSPNVDLNILQRLKTTTAKLEKRTEALRQSQPEPNQQVEKDVPVTGSKAESSESEGAKWAKILRQKSIGGISGYFRSEWGYIDPDGKIINLLEAKDLLDEKYYGSSLHKFRNGLYLVGHYRTDNKSQVELANVATSGVHDFIRLEDIKDLPSRANFLVIDSWRNDKKEVIGRKFSYYYWLDQKATGDPRGWIRHRFGFVMESEDALQLESALKKNPDLIEDVFLHMYPGITGGEKGIKRLTVDKLILVDQTSPEPVRETLSFSHPVGEVPFKVYR